MDGWRGGAPPFPPNQWRPPGSNPHWTMVLSFRWGGRWFQLLDQNGASASSDSSNVSYRSRQLDPVSSPACCAFLLSCRCNQMGWQQLGDMGGKTRLYSTLVDLIGTCTYPSDASYRYFPPLTSAPFLLSRIANYLCNDVY